MTLSYTNTLIHRVVQGGWIQSGGIVDGSGSGGELMYGATLDGNYINHHFALFCDHITMAV